MSLNVHYFTDESPFQPRQAIPTCNIMVYYTLKPSEGLNARFFFVSKIKKKKKQTPRKRVEILFHLISIDTGDE